MRLILLAVLLTACGKEERPPPKKALCKTLKDGRIERYVVRPEDPAMTSIMISMGFEPCY